MTAKDIHDALDRAVGKTEGIDMALRTWTQGRRMRRRRHAAYTGGGTVLAAAAIVGAIALGGGLDTSADLVPATPTQEVTQEDQGVRDSTGAPTFVFQREGVPLEAETSDFLSLDDAEVPTTESLTGTSWELVSPLGFAGGEPPEGMEITVGDGQTIGAEVPTTLTFVETEQETKLSMLMGDCGRATFPGDLVIAGDGRFDGQTPAKNDQGCPSETRQAMDYWMGVLPAGGWVHLANDDVLLLTVQPSVQGAPEGAVSIGSGFGMALPEGWSYLPRSAGENARTCLLPDGEASLVVPDCARGVEARTGLSDTADTPEGNWWDPTADTEGLWFPEQCYGDPEGYLGWTEWRDNPVTFDPDPDTGETTVGGHPVAWSRWAATCADGQEFTAEAWRVTDLGIEVRAFDSTDHDLEALTQSLVLDDEVPPFTQQVVQVSEPVGDAVVGELQEWAPGSWQGTGEQVSLPISGATWCLATWEDGQMGLDLERADCAALESDTDEYSVVNVMVSADGEVILVHVMSGA